MNSDDSLIPEYHHPMDKKWIEAQLSLLDIVTRYRVLNAYSAVYAETWEAEPIEYKKDNKARFEANTRLRVFVEYYSKTRNVMHVLKPEEKQLNNY